MISDEKDFAERWATGLAVCDQVYGKHISDRMRDMQNAPFVAETVAHQFRDIWAMPNLSIAQKRLLVIGATTMLGRPDLIEVQVRGAIANGELNDAQLGEMPLLMLFYSGAGNAGALMAGIAAARKRLPEGEAE
jgi:4-carboxymuconolactone decarboxylase